MQWLRFTKVETVNVKLQNGWIWTVQRCGRSWKNPGDRKHSWPTRARKKTEVPLLITPQKHEGKAATKPSPKLQTLGHRSRCAVGSRCPPCTRYWGATWGWSSSRCCIARSLRAANHVAMRAQKCRKIPQKMAVGTLPNLVFTDEKKFDFSRW